MPLVDLSHADIESFGHLLDLVFVPVLILLELHPELILLVVRQTLTPLFIFFGLICLINNGVDHFLNIKGNFEILIFIVEDCLQIRTGLAVTRLAIFRRGGGLWFSHLLFTWIKYTLWYILIHPKISKMTMQVSARFPHPFSI